MFQVNSTESLPSSAPVSASSIHTTAPQAVCVTSYTTMLAFATGSARTLNAHLPAASHHSLPVQIDLQTYLAALQEATRHLQPVPLSAILLAPCSSSMPVSLVSSSPSFSSTAGASSTHSAASASPSSFPGGSLSIIHPYSLCCTGGPICLVDLPCWLCGWFHHPHHLSHHTNVSLGSACFRACFSHRSFIADYHTFTLTLSSI